MYINSLIVPPLLSKSSSFSPLTATPSSSSSLLELLIFSLIISSKQIHNLYDITVHVYKKVTVHFTYFQNYMQVVSKHNCACETHFYVKLFLSYETVLSAMKKEQRLHYLNAPTHTTDQ